MSKAKASSPSWLVMAWRERGVKEKPGRLARNPRIVEYLKTCSNLALAWITRTGDEIAWCSAFINWCLIRAGYTGTNHALAKSWASWGFPCGLVNEAPAGAVLVLRRKAKGPDKATGSRRGFHVTFLLRYKAPTANSPAKVRGWGGNQRDQVKGSWYPLDKYEVIAVRWPWNLEDEAALAPTK